MKTLFNKHYNIINTIKIKNIKQLENAELFKKNISYSEEPETSEN